MVTFFQFANKTYLVFLPPHNNDNPFSSGTFPSLRHIFVSVITTKPYDSLSSNQVTQQTEKKVPQEALSKTHKEYQILYMLGVQYVIWPQQKVTRSQEEIW